jgi:hypothetical protein
MKLITGILIMVVCGCAVRAVAWVATWLGNHF